MCFGAQWPPDLPVCDAYRHSASEAVPLRTHRDAHNTLKRGRGGGGIAGALSSSASPPRTAVEMSARPKGGVAPRETSRAQTALSRGGRRGGKHTSGSVSTLGRKLTSGPEQPASLPGNSI